MKKVKNIPDKVENEITTAMMSHWKKYFPGYGFFALWIVIAGLAAVASFDFSPEMRLVVAGEIAPRDIVADRSFLYEDRKATKERKEQVRQFQPLICDLVLVPVNELREKTQSLINELNQAESLEAREEILARLNFETKQEIPYTALTALSFDGVQDYVLQKAVPFLQTRLRDGVLAEMRTVMRYRGGVTIRDLITSEETHITEMESLPDLKTLETELLQRLKSMPGKAQTRQPIAQLLMALVQPTLLPNVEVTRQRALAVESAVSPVMFKVNKGETLVNQGTQVTKDVQTKVQAMWPKKSNRFNWSEFAGMTFLGLLLSTGLLFSPSGRSVTQMNQRDHVFIASLVAFFALIAKALDVLGSRLAENSSTFPAESLAYAVPVAGAAALASMIFSTRRYLVFGLLTALFCTMMSDGGLGLFLFYFMSAMLSTWLISRSQTRQEIVWTVIPLTFGLVLLWSGSTMIQGGPYNRFVPELISLVCGAVFSMLVTFAFAPVVEMVFGYTTRFKLMELLNLEQPILRDLMLNAPGTYHHSLIVSNMVEAGAKAVGAHSLLCKVAALYHDIGKISKAGYFIENQFAAENPHDKLAPSMSALVLLSHTKKGEELGTKHKLGREVTDIIRQHHGTGVIRYFYSKAVRQAEEAGENGGLMPNIEDFSYPGPKPQSKEAAIVMLADAVEASSRVLSDPSPNRLKAHIDTVMKSIFADGQLDESELTFRDLDILATSFHRILTGIFHHRVEYPDRNKPGPIKVGGRVINPGAPSDTPEAGPASEPSEPATAKSADASRGEQIGKLALRQNSGTQEDKNIEDGAKIQGNGLPPTIIGEGFVGKNLSEASTAMVGGTVDWTVKQS